MDKKPYDDRGSCRTLRKAYFERITEFTATVAKVMEDKVLLRNIRLAGDEEREKETGEHVWITHASPLLARKVAEGDRIIFKAKPYRYEKADGRSDYSLKKIYETAFLKGYGDFVPEQEENKCDRCKYMMECMNGGGVCFFGSGKGENAENLN